MKSEFRLNLAQARELLNESASKITNPTITGVLENMTGGTAPAWLKAHGDVTWEKS